jgi:signal peptidase I
MDIPTALVALTLALAAAAALRRVVGVTRVESWSMAPSLRPGDHVLTVAATRLRRGDVVVFRSQDAGRPVIKRVVGLAGDTVEVGKRGVAVDGVPLDEPYARQGGRTGRFTVPDGAVLVLGDNRPASSDSRSWRQPFVPVRSVTGRALRVRGQGACAPGP